MHPKLHSGICTFCHLNNAISSVKLGEAVKNVRVDFMWWCTLLAIDLRRQKQADLSLVYRGNPSHLGLRGETQPQKENENVKERKRTEGTL